MFTRREPQHHPQPQLIHPLLSFQRSAHELDLHDGNTLSLAPAAEEAARKWRFRYAQIPHDPHRIPAPLVVSHLSLMIASATIYPPTAARHDLPLSAAPNTGLGHHHGTPLPPTVTYRLRDRTSHHITYVRLVSTNRPVCSSYAVVLSRVRWRSLNRRSLLNATRASASFEHLIAYLAYNG